MACLREPRQGTGPRRRLTRLRRTRLGAAPSPSRLVGLGSRSASDHRPDTCSAGSRLAISGRHMAWVFPEGCRSSVSIAQRGSRLAFGYLAADRSAECELHGAGMRPAGRTGTAHGLISYARLTKPSRPGGTAALDLGPLPSPLPQTWGVTTAIQYVHVSSEEMLASGELRVASLFARVGAGTRPGLMGGAAWAHCVPLFVRSGSETCSFQTSS